MNIESIKSRIEFLTAQAKQLELNLHAIGGAIQDCQYWLTQLENKDAADQVNDTQGVESEHQG
jgi:prefoldin subunit 5